VGSESAVSVRVWSRRAPETPSNPPHSFHHDWSREGWRIRNWSSEDRCSSSVDPYSKCGFSFHPGHVEMFQQSDLVRDPGQGLDPVERHPGFEGFSQVGSILGPSHGPNQTPGRVQTHIQAGGHPFGQ
jgi:hypothetical protein